MNLELTEEERAAFRWAMDKIAECKERRMNYHDLDDGFLQACILANLLNRYAFTVLRDMKRPSDPREMRSHAR